MTDIASRGRVCDARALLAMRLLLFNAARIVLVRAGTEKQDTYRMMQRHSGTVIRTRDLQETLRRQHEV